MQCEGMHPSLTARTSKDAQEALSSGAMLSSAILVSQDVHALPEHACRSWRLSLGMQRLEATGGANCCASMCAGCVPFPISAVALSAVALSAVALEYL